jgi:hypothetical protein
MNLVLFLRQNGIIATIFPITFESLIPRARNAAAAYFLSDNDNTHILFIDSDIEFTPNDVLKLIVADKEIVGAAYAQKWLSDNIIKEVSLSSNSNNILELSTRASVHLEEPNKKPELLMKCEYITTGFLLIKRSAFEKIKNKYHDRYYVNDIDGYSGISNNKFYDFFPIGINIDTFRYESEDYGFSRLYKSTSTDEDKSEIWCSTDITLKHHGWFGFSNNLFKQLELINKS